MAEPKVRFRRDDGSSYPAWRTIPMSEIFTEISEKNHPELPVLSVQQGVGTVLRDSSDRNILYDKSNLKNYKAMKKDDYIIHLRSFEGGLECSNYDGISSPAYRILRSQAILPAAYRDYFRSYEFIHNKLAVSVVGIRDGKNIDMDTFWQIPMSIPCLEEQQKIADFLSSVDEVISTSEQEVANLETQKKAVMKEIFSQVVRFKRDDGSDFPEWEEKTIREFAQCVAGATPSTKNDAYWNNGTIPWMSSGEVNKGLVFETDAKITPLGYANTSTKLVPADTVVMALAGQGKTRGMVALTKIELCTNQSLCSIVSDGSVNSAYLYQYLKTQYQNLRQISSGDGTRGGLNLQLVGDYAVSIPCLEEQRLIADFLSNFDEAIVAAKKELELWKELKKGLLQQMFV